MALDLDALLNDSKWIPVTLGVHTFNVCYRPHAFSLDRQAEIRRTMARIEKEGEASGLDPVAETAKMVCETVTEWDLERNNQRIPVNIETVRKLPDTVLTAIMDAVTLDKQVVTDEKKALNGNSAAGSQQGARLVTAQNGIQSSEVRGTWA